MLPIRPRGVVKLNVLEVLRQDELNTEEIDRLKWQVEHAEAMLEEAEADARREQEAKDHEQRVRQELLAEMNARLSALSDISPEEAVRKMKKKLSSDDEPAQSQRILQEDL